MLIRFAVLALQLVAPAVSEAEPAAGILLVVSETAQMRTGQSVVAEVPRWTRLRIERAEGDWFGVHFEGKSGWVHRAEALPIEIASERFHDAVRRSPKAKTYLDRAQFLYAIGEYEKSAEDCDNVLARAPWFSSAFLLRGHARMRLGQYGIAIALDYKRYVKAQPQDPVGHLWLARAHLAEARRFASGTYCPLNIVNGHDSAIGSLGRAIEQDPRSTAAYMERGDLWLARAEYDRAIDDYTQVIRLVPQSFQGYYKRGAAHHGRGEPDAALADLALAIRLFPREPFVIALRGNVQLARREYDKAIADYSEALRIAPDLAAAYYNRGLAWRLKGNHERAAADFEEARKIDGQLLAPAIAPSGTAEIVQQMRSFDPTAGPDPALARSYLDRATSETYQHRALDDLNAAIRVDSGFAYAYYKRAEVWAAQGEEVKAIADYTAALKRNSASETLATLAYTARGRLRARRKDWHAAIEDFTRAISLNPGFGPYLDRGTARLAIRDEEGAIADLSRVDPAPFFGDAIATAAIAISHVSWHRVRFAFWLLTDPSSISASVGRAVAGRLSTGQNHLRRQN